MMVMMMVITPPPPVMMMMVAVTPPPAVMVVVVPLRELDIPPFAAIPRQIIRLQQRDSVWDRLQQFGVGAGGHNFHHVLRRRRGDRSHHRHGRYRAYKARYLFVHCRSPIIRLARKPTLAQRPPRQTRAKVVAARSDVGVLK